MDKGRQKYLYNRFGIKTPAKRRRKSSPRSKRTVHVRGYCRGRLIPSWLRDNDAPF